jgi:serine/threonine protein phosphatase PrpC
MSQTRMNQEPAAGQSTVVLRGRRPALAVRSFGLTDPGRVRAVNEDQFLIAELAKAMRVQQSSLPRPTPRYSSERGHLFVVADGMGGHQAGRHASALAVETIEEFVLDRFKWFLHAEGPEEQSLLAEFECALCRSDERTFEEAAEHPEFRGMGTTVTVAYVVGSDLFVAHVGDSRCYLLREGALRQLTRDHTLVQEMIHRGLLRPEDAGHHHLRHVIINAVGGNQHGIRVEVHHADLDPGDTLLLCTDGLTEEVSDDDITAILAAEPDPCRACQRLVGRANECGGSDNITALVARFEAHD